MTPEERTEDIYVHAGGVWADNQEYRQIILTHIREAVAEEREACAKLADGYGKAKLGFNDAKLVALAIRKRGK